MFRLTNRAANSTPSAAATLRIGRFMRGPPAATRAFARWVLWLPDGRGPLAVGRRAASEIRSSSARIA